MEDESANLSSEDEPSHPEESGAEQPVPTYGDFGQIVSPPTFVRRPRRRPRILLLSVLGLFLGLILAAVVLYCAPGLREQALAERLDEAKMSGQPKLSLVDLRKQQKTLDKQTTTLRKKFAGLIPRQPYLIINTAQHEVRLMAGDSLLRKGICSTGSSILLKDPFNGREWLFTTPRGMFRVIGKQTNPVWWKPDWAFIEEGMPVPPKNSPDRFESGVLGDYALAIGNGYLIHGTLYKRSMGMPVTHGCIRLLDEDLEVVYKSLDLGSRVYIY